MSTSIHAAQAEHQFAILQIPGAARLPIVDLPADPAHFVALRQNMKVIGVAGIERPQQVALLRSVTVDPAFQQTGVARMLQNRLPADAQNEGDNGRYRSVACVQHQRSV